jgi:AP-4 complex subunit mu-1
MKSYLQGNPELRLALNEDLVIKGQQMSGGYGAVQLDDCNFHECADLSEFADTKTLSFYPPDGEFAVMNYRITGDLRVPFRIFPFVERQSAHKLEVTIKIRADVPDQNYGGNVQVMCALPKTTANVSFEQCTQMPGQTTEYLEMDHKIIWNIKKFQGGQEATIKVRVGLSTPIGPEQNFKKDLGPISMNFEIPMYNVSNLQVKYLRIAERHKSYNPCRWVRYVTQTSSYVCRF